MESAWVFGVPLGSAPDEPAHAFRAVSLWEGDFIPAQPAPRSAGRYQVTLPSSTANALMPGTCTAFRENVSNSCARKFRPIETVTTDQPSGAARYLPVYYAVVGWPSVLNPGRHGVYGIRLLSGLTCAAMLAAAIGTAVRMRRPLLPVIGAAASITPMVTGMGAVVNPSAWEISGGILLWTALLGLLGGRVAESTRSLLVKVGVGGTAMLITRQISVLWTALIILTVVVAAGRPALTRAVGRARRNRLAQAVGLLLIASAVCEQYWYTAVATTFASSPTRHESLSDRLIQSTLHVPLWLTQTWGVLGWLDARTPLLGLVTWVAVLGLLMMFALLGSRGWLRWSVIGTVVVAVVVSVVIEAAFWNVFGNAASGYWWQGRYTMPYSMGLPLLCGVVGGAAWRWNPGAGRSLARWTILPLGAVSFLSYVAVLHRFAVGASGSWYPWTWSWRPPAGPYTMVLLYSAGSLLLTALLVRAAGSAPDAAEPTASGAEPGDDRLPAGSGGGGDDVLPPVVVLARAGDVALSHLAEIPGG